MQYVDGYVIAVPNANKESYRSLAETAAVIFKDHGALSVVECWGDLISEKPQQPAAPAPTTAEPRRGL